MWTFISRLVKIMFGLGTRFFNLTTRIFAYRSLPPPKIAPSSPSPLTPPKMTSELPHVIIDIANPTEVKEIDKSNGNIYKDDNNVTTLPNQNVEESAITIIVDSTPETMNVVATTPGKRQVQKTSEDEMDIKRFKSSKVDKRRESRIKGKKPNTSKSKKILTSGMEETNEESETHIDKRPNYFIAIRVSDSEILKRVQALQERMAAVQITSIKNCGGESFRETFISLSKLHFTLHVLHLKTSENLASAVKVLKDVCEDYQREESKKLQLKIKGLGHFKNSVLFAKIDGQEEIARLGEMALRLRHEYLMHLNVHGDSKTFQSHMTVAKMSKAKKLCRNKIRGFPRELWTNDEDLEFGIQSIDTLQLLSMIETDPVTKYYKIVAEFKFC